ncbi:hypothetical protein ACQV2B_16990 [Pantoea allii]|uniref:hypothetical protein n=1 Tax=Pantoea allii TaxID=574096 RepID=UPI003D3237EC
MKKKRRVFLIAILMMLQFSSNSFAFSNSMSDGINDGCQNQVDSDGIVTGSCGFSAFVVMKTKLETAPWCIINNNESMNVVFDTVDPYKISSGLYKKTLEYDFICSDATPGYNVFFKLEGINAAGFEDEQTIQTSVNGLGMQILMDGIPMKVHEKKLINMVSPPLLEVLLVRQPTKILEGDEFSGTASMTVVYD